MHSPSQKKVYVTGMGAITALGETLSLTWENLLQKKSAQRPITLFDVSQCRCQQGCEAKPSVLTKLSLKQQSRLSRASHLAIIAAAEALTNASLSLSTLPLTISTTGGGMAFGESFLKKTLAHSQINTLALASRYQPQQQALDLQNYLEFSGTTFIVANACASGANAIGHAYHLIKSGQSNIVLTGGFEAMTELIFVGFDSLQASSQDCCRPFDQNRSGLILGEGAAFLILESETSARTRGATILAELIGYGNTTDTHHLTQPSPQGQALVQAMQKACDTTKIKPQQIGYINAHGTGTPLNDVAEAISFTKFFSDAPFQISSTKAALGHTLGAAGAIEAALTIKALQENQLPPQINLKNPMLEMAPHLVITEKISSPLNYAMSVNLGFGGSNAALLFKRYDN